MSRDDDADGCGDSKWWWWNLFPDACHWHDEATKEGSWHQKNMTLKQVNMKFREFVQVEAKYRGGLTRKIMWRPFSFIANRLSKYYWEGK